MGSVSLSLARIIVSLLLILVMVNLPGFAERLVGSSPSRGPVISVEAEPSGSSGGTPGPSVDEVAVAVVDYLNSVRSGLGLPNVSLVDFGVAEYRAMDMLENRYFGHCSPDGSPYFLYYTLLGGSYYPEENVGVTFSPGVLSVDPVGEALSHLESMLFDDEDSGWGHRDSLLDPTNNYVEVGYAWDEKAYYIVVYMYKAWVNWTVPPAYSGGVFRAEGFVTMPGSSVQSIGVYRWEKPRVMMWPSKAGITFTCQSITGGEPVAVVVPDRGYSSTVETIIASEWSVEGQYFRIEFEYTPPPGDDAYYYVIVWIENTLGVEHPYDPGRYSEAIPALLYVIGVGG